MSGCNNVRFIEVGQLKKGDSLLKKLQEEKIQIFITHCHYYLPIIEYFPQIKSLGIKIILQQHAGPWCPIYEKRLELWKKQESYFKYCDLITVVDKPSQVYWELRGFNVKYLPNCVSLEKNVSLKEKLVLMAGRFEYFKNIEEGIVAFSIAHASHPDWSLIIIGQGPCQKKIEQTIQLSGCSDHITLLPWGDVKSLFAKTSIHLIPSHIEPFGLVICEAKAAEAPTVMYDLPANDLVRHGVDGFKAKLGDVWELSQHLTRLMADEPLRQKMGSQGKEVLVENSAESVRKVWNEIFQSLSDAVDKTSPLRGSKTNVSEEDFKLLLASQKSIFDQLQIPKKVVKKNETIFQKLKRKKNQLSDENSSILIGLFVSSLKFIKNSVSGKWTKFKNQLVLRFFNLVDKNFEKNTVVFWDSNTVGMFGECLNRVQPAFHYKVFNVYKGGLTFSQAYWLARSKVFVTNTNTPIVKRLLSLKQRPLIINAWHGCGYFKKFGVDENNMGVMQFRQKFGTPDYVCCSSINIKDEYARIFGVGSGAVLPIGFPRTDLLIDSDLKKQRSERFFEKFPNLKAKKLFLYAPTWRGTAFSKVNPPHFNCDLCFDEVAKLLKEDEVILFKNHQSVIKRLKIDPHACSIKCNNTNIINVDDFDASTLLSVCDVLITDFSSIFFEALLLNKPVLFFAEDSLLYQATSGLYAKWQDYAPNLVYTGSEPKEFLSMIRQTIEDGSKSSRYLMLKDKFLHECDGSSTQRLVDFIESHLRANPS